MLVLHIGLSKTATTFLQHRIFKATRGLQFIHRRRGRAAARLCGDLGHYVQTNALLALFFRRRVRTSLAAIARGAKPGQLLLVTEENVAVTPMGFWRGAGAGPAGAARRLAALARGLEGLAPVRVLIGIRRQDQWLASRYAESSKHFPDFGQADFDRRMAAIAAGARLDGALGWLDYHAVHRHFTAALGAENLLLLPLERLAQAPQATLAELGGFMGGLDLARRYVKAAGAEPEGLRRNRLADGADLWRLRRDGAPLALAPALREALLARFADGNRALAALLPLGF